MREPQYRLFVRDMPKTRENVFFSFFLACGSKTPVTSTSHLFSYLQPWQQKASNGSANYTAPFVSQAKQEIRLLSAPDGIKKHLVSSVLSNPILTPSHVPMWGCAAPQNRLGNSTNDLPGKSQRAAITCSFADAPLLHGARVWFLSGRPSFSLSLFLLSLSLHLYHLLILLSVSPACFLSFPFCVSVTLVLHQPVGLSVSDFFFFLFSLLGLPFLLHNTSSAFFFTLKNVLVGCVSRRNAGSDCVLYQRRTDDRGVLLLPSFVPQQVDIAATNPKSKPKELI